MIYDISKVFGIYKKYSEYSTCSIVLDIYGIYFMVQQPENSVILFYFFEL